MYNINNQKHIITLARQDWSRMNRKASEFVIGFSSAEDGVIDTDRNVFGLQISSTTSSDLAM